LYALGYEVEVFEQYADFTTLATGFTISLEGDEVGVGNLGEESIRAVVKRA
jgi:hypothetical protein